MNKWLKGLIALTAIFPAMWFCMMGAISFFLNLITGSIENAVWGISFVACFYIYVWFLKSWLKP